MSNLYIFLANTFISLPHEPVIIILGKSYNPFFVTFIALIPTFLACLADVDLLRPLIEHSRLKSVKTYKSYRWLETKFSRAPFFTNFFVAATPLPFTVIRILTLLSGYSKWKYAFAVTLGRIPRYFLLAYFGKVFQIPDWILVSVFLLFLILPLTEHILQKRENKQISETFTPSLEEVSQEN